MLPNLSGHTGQAFFVIMTGLVFGQVKTKLYTNAMCTIKRIMNFPLI